MSVNAMLTAPSPAAFKGALQRCTCPQISPRVSSCSWALKILNVQVISMFLTDSMHAPHSKLWDSGLQVGGARHTTGRQRSLDIIARIGSPKRGANIVKTQADLRKERREQLGDGNIWEAIVDSHQRLAEDVDIKKLLGTAFVIGVTFGTAFQPTHNNGYLPVSSRAAVWGDQSV